jgi:hypothetical protein
VKKNFKKISERDNRPLEVMRVNSMGCRDASWEKNNLILPKRSVHQIQIAVGEPCKEIKENILYDHRRNINTENYLTEELWLEKYSIANA